MDKIKIIIDDIKKLFIDLNYNEDKMLQTINKKYMVEIEKNDLNKKDLIFLIELTTKNIDLSSAILKDIFLNSKNKTEHKILVSVSDNNKNVVSDNNSLNIQVLDIFSNIGSIFIKPEKLYLLWNNKNNNNKYINSSDEKKNIEIKPINYSIFLDRENSVNDNLFLSNITDHYLRNFGLDKETGLKTRYQLTLALDNDNTFTSINELYFGDCEIYIEDLKASVKLKSVDDIYKIVSKLKPALISFYSKNNTKAINLLKLFFSNKSLYPYINIIFESLKKEKVIIPKKKITKFQYVEKKQTGNLLNLLFMSEPCEHIEEYEKIYTSGKYSEKIDEFIKNYINYEDGRAICVLCRESIKELNIQAGFFINKEKFITTPDNILFYPPYNRFNNLKFFMDNLFYIFMFNTKMGIYNTTLVTRIFLDNLILVSSNRIELEIQYKQDIIDENIFLLRLTNNFFESYDLEKERYKEKRTLYTNLPAYIIILITSTVNDYNDYFFLKKRLKLNKINPVWSDITFEDVMAYIIDSVFKNIGEGYLEQSEKIRINKIKRSIQIYYEIFNEEFKIIYQEKKIIFERYLKSRSERIMAYEIGTIDNFKNGTFSSEFNDLGQYLLNVKKVDMLRHEKELKYYKNLNMKLEDINKNINIDTNIIKDFKINKTFFDKKNKILNLDLFELYKKENTKKEQEELDLVSLEFLNEEYYSYNKQKYTVLPINNFFVLYSEKQKIQFEDTDLLDILSLNTYTNKELIEGDIFLYIEHIKISHIEYILRKFLSYISTNYNITIKSNMNKFLKDGINNRKELFLLKIKILNLIMKLKN